VQLGPYIFYLIHIIHYFAADFGSIHSKAIMYLCSSTLSPQSGTNMTNKNTSAPPIKSRKVQQ
jgi:hypothetical protein